MTKLTPSQELQALTNALRSHGFHEKYTIYVTSKRNKKRFTIQSMNDDALQLHTHIMTYDEMNACLFGYRDGLKRKHEDT